jgi:hypothetical protein
MITRKQNTCCFKPTNDTNILEVKNPQETLRKSLCDTCWHSLIRDTFNKDIRMIADLSVSLKLTYRHMSKDIIDVIAADAYSNVYKKMDHFECTMVQIVGDHKIPTKLKAFAKTAAENLMKNYLKSPRFKMCKRTKQMKLKANADQPADAQGDIEFEDQEDTEQKLADELCFESERKEFFDKEVENIKSQLTKKNKALRQRIIDLNVKHYLKNSEIVLRLKNTSQHLIPKDMMDKQLLSLVNNTLSQLRTELKERVKKF